MTKWNLKALAERRCGALSSQGGSVALEYIVLLVFCVFSYICWLELFEPGVGFTEYGKQFTAFFQRILVGVSLPVP